MEHTLPYGPLGELDVLTIAAAAILFLLAILHSVLGELALLRPLFAESWRVAVPRAAAETILRFAWHLTSIAWVGLGAALLGLPLVHAAALVCAASGAAVFFTLRGHLAWPLFLGAAACLWASVGAIPSLVLYATSLGGAGLALAIAGLHAYWGLGGRWGFAAAVPTGTDGHPAFLPGALACFAVSAACATLAGLLGWAALGTPPALVNVSIWIALGVCVVRAIGDGRQVGFSKADHGTAFARADDALYSPLVVALAAGCGCALLLA